MTLHLSHDVSDIDVEIVPAHEFFVFTLFRSEFGILVRAH